jgi:hypothetical protein
MHAYSGVDHVGHRYHANHPAMQDKLLEMDRMLDNVLDTLHQQYAGSDGLCLFFCFFG